MNKRFLILLFALCLFISACGIQIETASTEDSGLGSESSLESVGNSNTISATGELKVHFLDVGQGDSIFVELPNGECMLIDCSERDYAGGIISFIDMLGYRKINHLVATHPHADHIGGMETVINNFDIGEVYMPEAVSETKTFMNLLEALDKKNASITVATAGVEIDFGSGAYGKFVAPVDIVDDLNNCSAVLHLTFGERAFLFTGDAEIMEEDTISDNIKADVLKAGHHGSSTSSGSMFLKKVGAEIAVISCGKDNSYGHPHREALERFENAGIKQIYRTDASGNITITSDGKTLDVATGFVPTEYTWVLNISGLKVHSPDCKSATSMAEKNCAYSTRSLTELQRLGYSLCGTCKPQE